MERPIALKLLSNGPLQAYQVQIDPTQFKMNSAAAGTNEKPAILVSRQVTLLENLQVGLIDAADIYASCDGDWNQAILVVIGDVPDLEVSKEISASKNVGDHNFLHSVSKSAPMLHDLAKNTLDLIRSSGVEGHLIEKGGRWVNSPINSFTIKAQPRAANLQFTVYGNPHTYAAADFLRKDQNSYSRGWIADAEEARRFVDIVKEAHSRRTS